MREETAQILKLSSFIKLCGVFGAVTGLITGIVGFALCGLLLAPVLHWPVQFVLRRLGGVQLSDK